LRIRIVARDFDGLEAEECFTLTRDEDQSGPGLPVFNPAAID